MFTVTTKTKTTTKIVNGCKQIYTSAKTTFTNKGYTVTIPFAATTFSKITKLPSGGVLVRFKNPIPAAHIPRAYTPVFIGFKPPRAGKTLVTSIVFGKGLFYMCAHNQLSYYGFNTTKGRAQAKCFACI